jgi:hypothetical protein
VDPAADVALLKQTNGNEKGACKGPAREALIYPALPSAEARFANFSR